MKQIQRRIFVEKKTNLKKTIRRNAFVHKNCEQISQAERIFEKAKKFSLFSVVTRYSPSFNSQKC